MDTNFSKKRRKKPPLKNPTNVHLAFSILHLDDLKCCSHCMINVSEFIWHWPWNHIFFNQVLEITKYHSLCSEGLPLLFLSAHTSERDLYCQTHINNWWHCYCTEGLLFLCHSYNIFSSISICWVVPMVPQPLATTRTFGDAFFSQNWRHSSHQMIFPISKCMLKMFLKFRDCIFSILFVPPKNIKINLGPPEIQKMFFRQQIGL